MREQLVQRERPNEGENRLANPENERVPYEEYPADDRTARLHQAIGRTATDDRRERLARALGEIPVREQVQLEQERGRERER